MSIIPVALRVEVNNQHKHVAYLRSVMTTDTPAQIVTEPESHLGKEYSGKKVTFRCYREVTNQRFFT